MARVIKLCSLGALAVVILPIVGHKIDNEQRARDHVGSTTTTPVTALIPGSEIVCTQVECMSCEVMTGACVVIKGKDE